MNADEANKIMASAIDHAELKPHEKLACHAGLAIVFSISRSLERIATALERTVDRAYETRPR
jgi:hypothetical protein